ncbi:DUF1499 domain-containing protein [Pseudoalteromonas sp. NZS127_1]|uniref:DUF1499 domain-containing protein n=1 Tax=Pseudoalteromonas arctica A 37-1-2 TaxID=1117313 RepID=A0A290S8Q0_9GAMM|nr:MULTISPECIES: DUF1499 domain-containing protein [Pseudoalteromonas]ATC87381.1 hypothetical protein PARC_a2948 [Pseudoalteromonas arctica A 37-1-2]MBA6411362.1 DUF1499 domain-containing protein [Pseudoalteromonas sp. 5Ae-yellow]MBG9995465.1 DUF1499 domain-containing protein [Pseudoalteromonas sp. NZS127_1]MBG9998131.1 DUF1499 domain-containing protein [Pseudoalteromonas sp. NSLLW24]MBZ2191807.1 DUF1499 domain-containing protein [Pseudoalteromonas arctica]
MKVLVSLVSLIAFLLVILPGPLYKFGIVELGVAFTGFKFGVYAGGAALVLLIVQALFMRKTLTLSSGVIALVFSVVAIAMPLNMMNKAEGVPAIHDISTDLVNPPKFVAIAPLRANASNPVEYAGEETAVQQRKAYPELVTLSFAQSKADLMTASEQAVKNLGFALVSANTATGIVEATDTTTWFGFKDDVVIRIKDEGSQRFVDIRSKSRVGRSDLGKNAERIHSIINELNSLLAK